MSQFPGKRTFTVSDGFLVNPAVFYVASEQL